MNLTEAERRVADDAERYKGEASPRLPLLQYVAAILMVCAGILGLWEQENVPQSLLLIGFAFLQLAVCKLQYRYRIATSLIYKLHGERLSAEI